MRGWIAGLIAAILATVIGGLILAALQHPPPPPTTPVPHVPNPNPIPAALALSRSSGPPGTTLTVSGTGFAPGERVVLRFHTTELKKVPANPQGAFSGQSVTLPADWPFKGQFLVFASGETSGRSTSEPFQVT